MGLHAVAEHQLPLGMRIRPNFNASVAIHSAAAVNSEPSKYLMPAEVNGQTPRTI